MALVFMDSWDHYTSILTKWSSTSGNASISAGSGRNGTAALFITNNDGVVQNIFTSQASWYVGWAWKYSSVGASGGVLSLLDSGTSQIDLRLDGTGFLRITRSGTTLATTSSPLVAGQMNYVEVGATIHSSTGVVIVKFNGVTVISISSQNTQSSGNATANTIKFGDISGIGTPTAVYDDLYVCDGSGSSPYNTFLGDCRVEALLPSGNGNSSQFVGSDADSTNNYLLVDEAAPNDDTDYVESSTVGNKDTYAFGDLATTSGTVLGLQALPYAKKTDAGTRTIVSVARVSSTEEDSADKALSTSYKYLPDIRTTKPGGGAWSISDVNGMEFGPKVTA